MFIYYLLMIFSTLASPTHQPPSLKSSISDHPPSLRSQPSPSIFDLKPLHLPSASICPISILTLQASISDLKPHPHPPSLRSQPSPSISDLKPSPSPSIFPFSTLTLHLRSQALILTLTLHLFNLKPSHPTIIA